MRSNRPVLYPEAVVRSMFARMRQELAEVSERYMARVTALQAKVAALSTQVDELRAIALARSKAELELSELRRLRDIGRARIAERDPARPLN